MVGLKSEVQEHGFQDKDAGHQSGSAVVIKRWVKKVSQPSDIVTITQSPFLRHKLRDPPRRKDERSVVSPALNKSTNTIKIAADSVIKNFRKARGLSNIYRCAKTDDLVDRLNVENNSLSSAERMLLYEAGLILDLRSPSEVKQDKVGKWTTETPGVKIESVSVADYLRDSAKESKRTILNLDILGPEEFASHAERRWLTSTKELIQLTYYKALDGEKVHKMRVDALNKRGIFGLNEAILESGREKLCQALKVITLHLEKKGENLYRPIVIHCAQGKDRTGMLVMLLQSIIGISDDDIIEDYHESESLIDTCKADITPSRPGRLNRAMMKRAPRSAMKQTLKYLQERYGSVSPGYLQSIGFDDSWRIRLVTALLLDMDRCKQMSPKNSRL